MSSVVNYAGTWRRIGAALIDGLLLIAVFFVLKAAARIYAFPVICLYEVLSALYYIILESSKYQGSLGKLITGLKLGDKTGRRLNPRQASWRYLCFLLPSLPLLILLISAPDLVNQARVIAHVPTVARTLDQHYKLRILGAFELTAIFLKILWFYPILFAPEKTGLHDLFSKTRVFGGKTQEVIPN